MTDRQPAGIGSRVSKSAFLHYLRSAPGTFVWLAILLMTTIIQHSVSPGRLQEILGAQSTNINHLGDDPVHVLITSLFWLDGYYWLPYLLLYCIFHVPAERWLGTRLWLSVGLIAHVCATFLSEGVLYWAIHHGRASEALVDVRDIGVSYFLAGIVGVLTYHLAYPWRWIYLGGMLALFAAPLFADLTFTGIGHFSSLLLGLACYPLVRGRRQTLASPRDAFARLRRLGTRDHGSDETGPTKETTV